MEWCVSFTRSLFTFLACSTQTSSKTLNFRFWLFETDVCCKNKSPKDILCFAVTSPERSTTVVFFLEVKTKFFSKRLPVQKVVLLVMSYEYLDNLDAEAKERYRKKIELVGLNICPYKMPADAWKNNPTEWPDVEYPDVYDYLINTPGM